MIILYDKSETSFVSNGLVVLNDCKTAFITEELNGQLELELEYPIDPRGKWAYLIEENVIKAEGQLFRIYRKTKTLTGVKVYARHIFYDLLGNLVELVDIRTLSGAAALNAVMSNTAYAHNFTYMSDITTTNDITLDNDSGDITNQNPVEAIFTLISIYGGELVRDNHNIKWLVQRGTNREVLVSYGKNITGIEEDLNTDDVITRIKPIGQDGLTLDEKFVDSPYIDSFAYPKIKPMEFSDCNDYDSLRIAAQKYFQDNKCDIPTVNYKVNIVELAKTEEYKNYKVFETFYLGDTLILRHTKLGIDLNCKVIKIKKDILTNQPLEIEFGNAQPNLADSFSGVNSQIQTLGSNIALAKSNLQKSIDSATALLTTALGGYVLKKENELLIMDTQDETTATKLWRWNLNGLGYSSTGINGPYRTAITIDGHIVADFMDTGTLTAAIIKSGILKSFNELSWINMESGAFNFANKITFDGTNFNVVLDSGKTVEQEISGSISDFINNTYSSDILDLQNQIDGSITTWFYDGAPTLSNNPAVNWTTDTDKNAHLGDLYYDNNNGYAYRFRLNGTTYEWFRITDTDITKALSDAANAQDTADSKKRVFLTTPPVPYDVGDLWISTTANGSNKVCTNARATGSYVDTDWANDSVTQRVTTAESSISQQANKIALVVKEIDGTSVVDSASIIAAINDDGTSKIDLSATNIDLSGYATFSSLNTPGLTTTIDGANITAGTITASQIKAGELVVGTNVSMGPNAVIDWTQIDTTWANASDIGALSSSSSLLTHITSQGIYTGEVNASQINGTTFNVSDYIQFVKDTTTLFKIGLNANGNAGQLYLNDSCSIDTNGSDLRMKVADNNYIRVNSGGGLDYYYPTGTGTYNVIPIVDSAGNLQTGTGSSITVNVVPKFG